MKVVKYPARETWSKLLQRPALDTKVLAETVSGILDDVRANGDAAMRKYSREFDNIELDEVRVSYEEFDEAESLVPQKLRDALAVAKTNIENFHAVADEPLEVIETTPGVFCWKRSLPIEKVGLYIPAGSAPLFSTVLMLAIPARLAGCREIVMCSPPDSVGKINAVTLYAARACGVTRVYKIGGAQAVAAMAYGTESVPSVYKIFGPGNQYVTEAKLQVMRRGVAIDMPAGPSEVAVLADETCVPSFVAADLLSQAEHGSDSQVVLVSTSENVIVETLVEIESQMETLSRKDTARAALKNSKAILVDSIENGMDMLNEYAPEHLIIATGNAERVAESVTNAGSVFIGNYSCESAGDYASGTNHTLPTNGAARAYSGVSVASFMKTITYQKLTEDGIRNLGPVIETLAQAEGLTAHKNAVSIRRDALMWKPECRSPHVSKGVDLDILVRKNIRRLKPYSSARSEFTGTAEVFLDANENAFGSPAGNGYNRYPDPLQTELKTRVAKMNSVSASRIFVGNGSDEAIDLLFRIFCEPGRDTCVICPPTYGMYRVSAHINDVSVQEVSLTNDFQLDVPSVLESVSEHTKLIFVCSPNNPTGNLMRRESIVEIAEKSNGIVVVDEAYIHFANEPSMIEELDRLPNLVVLQTFSKAWAMAGLRVGLAFASEAIIDLMNRMKPPYNVSGIAQRAVLDSLERKPEIDNWIVEILNERGRLTTTLKALPMVECVYHSDSNFVLVKTSDADAIYQYLVEEKIVVRNRNSIELCKGCLRITIGTPQENDRLLKSLSELELKRRNSAWLIADG